MIRLRRSGALTAACLTAAVLAAAGCVPAAKPQQVASPGGTASGTIELWHFFTDREAETVQQVVDDFSMKFPQVKVIVKAGQDDAKMIQAISAGQGPDVGLSYSTDIVGKFCSTGVWQDLGPYLSRDKVDLSDIPAPVQQYTAFQGKRCTLPFLADTYGLFYNKKLFAEAGIAAPPKTFSELAADAKKLTKRSSDGSLKVAGFDPLTGFYENSPAHFAALGGAKWLTADGKSAVGTDPAWQELLSWQKSLVDFYGYDKINKFQSSLDNAGSADNAFEKGQVAMNVDGEWRIADIAANAPKDFDWGVAPLPVLDSKPELYGAGYVSGNVIGISRSSKNPEAAWQLIRYLSTTTDSMVKLANGIQNVPTLYSALRSPNLSADAKFKVLIGIFANPKSSTAPPCTCGTAYQDAVTQFMADWQSGKVKDLPSGLKKLDDMVNQAIDR
jgi:multiple sugar transport system substrate-binding protein